MTDPAIRRRQLLWSSIGVGGFSATGWTYFNVGFVPSFLPLLVGIVALRRLLAVETIQTEIDLTERYDVDPDHDYTAAEQIEILSEVKGEYGSNGRVWIALSVGSAVIGAVATSQSLAVVIACAVVTGYCVVRYARIRRLLRTIDARIDELRD